MKTLREELKDILLFISWRQVARVYMGKSASWLYHKLDGVDPVTESEREKIKEALLSLAENIRRNALMMDVPDIVKEAASGQLQTFPDGGISRLGEYEGRTVYMFEFPENIVTGYPFVYLVNDDNVEKITGSEALKIIRHFFEQMNDTDDTD